MDCRDMILHVKDIKKIKLVYNISNHFLLMQKNFNGKLGESYEYSF